MAKGKGKTSGAASRNRPAKTAARNLDGPGNGAKTTDGPARPPAKAASATPEGAKAEVGGDTIGRLKPAESTDKKSSGPRTRPAPTKRTTPPASARYTPPVPKSEKVSPLWVPILMFACLGLGMLTIILNYVNVLPGPDPSNVYLMIGLGLITVGFITATKYH
ncbi:MAG TPA: cell division protein CrgA [Acidimicrobiales bacterium]